MKSNRYVDIKNSYKNHVVLVKSGMFYSAFDDDALLLFLFFGYNVNVNKASFPKSKLRIVLNMLSSKKVGYVIINKNGMGDCDFENVNYDRYVSEAKEKYEIHAGIIDIKNKIKFLIESNEKNLTKIEGFLNDIMLFIEK